MLSLARPVAARIDGESEGRGRVPHLCLGVEGRSPPPAQCSTLSMLAPETERYQEPVFECSDLESGQCSQSLSIRIVACWVVASLGA